MNAINPQFTAKLVLKKSPLERPKLDNTIQINRLINVVAQLNGWHKEHFSAIRDDDPYKEQLMFNNPDGMYFVDTNGYYVPYQKIEEAIEMYNKGISPIMDDNKLQKTIQDGLLFTQKLKIGGKFRSFQEGGTVIQSPEEVISNILNKSWDDLDSFDYNTLGVQYIPAKDAMKLLDLETDYKVNGTPLQDVINKNPNIKLPVLNGQIFSKNLWNTMRSEAMFNASSGAINDHNVEFEVQKEKNKKAGEKHSKMIDELGIGLMASLPATIAATTLSPSVAAILTKASPYVMPLLSAYYGSKAINSASQGDTKGAVINGAAAVAPGAAAAGTKALLSSYSVTGNLFPRLLTGAEALVGTVPQVAAETVNQSQSLSQYNNLDISTLQQVRPSEAMVEAELNRLGYLIQPMPDPDQVKVVGNNVPTSENTQHPIATHVTTVGSQLIGEYAANGKNVSGAIANGIRRAAKFVREKAHVPEYLNPIARRGTLGRLILNEAVVTPVVNKLVNGYWYIPGNTKNQQEQNIGQRAYNLITYLNQMYQSDPQHFHYHSVSPSSFSDKQRSGWAYENEEHKVPDSISPLESATVGNKSDQNNVDEYLKQISQVNIADEDTTDRNQ